MQAFRNVCYVLAAAGAFIGATRFGSWVLAHPKPTVGLYWLAASVVVGCIGWNVKTAQQLATLCWWIVGISVVIGVSRFSFAHMLTHPQPKVGAMWLAGAVAMAFVALLLRPARQARSPAPARG